MLRKFLTISLAICLLAIFGQTESFAQTKINFRKGKSSKTIVSTLKGNAEKSYSVNAYADQEIKIQLISKDSRIRVAGEGGPTGGVFDSVEGVNTFRIYNNSKLRTKFTIIVSIKDIVNATEKQVLFDKGTSSKIIKSSVGKGLIRVFTLNAKEGQTIEAKIESQFGKVLINEEEGARWLQMDAKNGANKIEIVNKGNTRSAYTLTFTIKDKPLPKATRVNFAKETTSKTIDLVMNKYQMKSYFVINVKKDQFIDVQVMSGEAAKRVGTQVIESRSIKLHNWVDDVGYLTMEANGNGDVVFEISKNDEKYLSSKMKVTIKDNPNTTINRIKFDKGKSSKTIDLVMGVGTKSRKFVIGAAKGQTINVDIMTKNAVERIAMNLNNGVDNQDDWLDGFGYLMVTTGRSGDYVIEVIKLDKKYLEAKMKISIKADK